ncbi:TonB-dependent receptor domain-containing protein [Phocaeicola sp.]
MKTRIIHLLLCCLLALAATAQTPKAITVEFKNEPLPSALKKLEQISDYRILFTYDDIQQYNVTVSIKNETIGQAMDKVMEGTPLTYTLKGKEYVVVIAASVKTVNSLSGKVKDTQHLPVEGATVVLLRNGKVITGSITNAEGNYFIPNAPAGNYELRISFLGCETFTTPIQLVADTTIEPVTLQELPVAMSGVTIVASAPAFRMKGGNVIANVANSVLSKETKAMDVLRKIPGMTMEDGKLTSFTGGTPLVYINGKKTRSMDEVKQLEVKNIKHVELITNPGAEYDASVSAVLLITTTRREDGWSVQLDGELSQNHRLSNEESMKVNYQTGGLNLFGAFTYGDYRRKSHQLMKTVITAPDTVWTQDMDVQCKAMTYSSYNYSAGADYAINDRHSIGIQYDGYLFDNYNDAPSYTRILANDKPYDYIEGHSILKNDNDYYHHLNAYYTGKLSEKAKLDVYADYANTHNGRTQKVDENSERFGRSEVNNTNEADYNVYAVSPKLSYTLNDNHSLVLGGEWNKVTGDSFLEYEGGTGTNSKSKTNEEKYAGFISYSYSQKNFSLTAGLRYENVASDYRNLYDARNSISRTYSNLFPSFGLSYKSGEVSQSLSYRTSISRPDFGRLNNYSYYVNRFSYQEGNPQLVPQTSHRFLYSLSYDFLYVSLGYTYVKDFIGFYMYTHPQKPEISINTWRNYDKQQQLSAVVNLRHRFGFYEPSLTGMYRQYIQKVESIDGLLSVDKPSWIVTFENNFHLPKDWLANVEYTYNSTNSYQWFTFREQHNMNISLSKMFMNERLQVKLAGEHLLDRRMSLYDGRINNIYFWQDEDQDQRRVTLSVVYRFNNYSKKYKGKSAADDVLNRL